MEHSLQFTCDACGVSILHDTREQYFPPEWGIKRVDGKLYCLCRICGTGWTEKGISPILFERFSHRGITIRQPERR